MSTADSTTRTGDELLAALGPLTIIYEDGIDGWIIAHLLELPAALSQGKSMADARLMVLDAARELLLAHQNLGTEPELHTVLGMEFVRAAHE